MPAASSIIGGIIAAAAVAGAGATAYSASKQSDMADEQKRNNLEMESQAKELADQQGHEAAQQRIAMERQQEEERTQKKNIAARDAAKARFKSLTAGAGGRSSTILTGPLGIQPGVGGGSSPLSIAGGGGGKTLLGS